MSKQRFLFQVLQHQHRSASLVYLSQQKRCFSATLCCNAKVENSTRNIDGKKTNNNPENSTGHSIYDVKELSNDELSKESQPVNVTTPAEEAALLRSVFNRMASKHPSVKSQKIEDTNENNKSNSTESQNASQNAEPLKRSVETNQEKTDKSKTLREGAQNINSTKTTMEANISNSSPEVNNGASLPRKDTSVKITLANSENEIYNPSDLIVAKDIVEYFEKEYTDMSLYHQPKTKKQRFQEYYVKFSKYMKYTLLSCTAVLGLYLLYKYKSFEADLDKEYNTIRTEIEKRVHEKTKNFFTNEGLVGLCVSIMLNEEICQEIALGYANIEHGAKCDPVETVTSVGSGILNDVLLGYALGRHSNLVEDVHSEKDSKKSLSSLSQLVSSNASPSSSQENVDKIDTDNVLLENESTPSGDEESKESSEVSVQPEESVEQTKMRPSPLDELIEFNQDRLSHNEKLFSLLSEYVEVKDPNSKPTPSAYNPSFIENIIKTELQIPGIYTYFPERVILHRANAYKRDPSTGNLLSVVHNMKKGDFLATSRGLCLLGKEIYTHPLDTRTQDALCKVLFQSISDWKILSSFSDSSSSDAGSSAIIVSPEFRMVVASTCNSGNVNLVPLNSQIAEEYSHLSTIDEEYKKGMGHHIYKECIYRFKRWLHLK